MLADAVEETAKSETSARVGADAELHVMVQEMVLPIRRGDGTEQLRVEAVVGCAFEQEVPSNPLLQVHTFGAVQVPWTQEAQMAEM